MPPVSKTAQDAPILSPHRIMSRYDLFILAAYLLITIGFSWPLVLHFQSYVLGQPADNLEYVWKVWWVPHALFERGISPFFHPDVYFPYGYPMAYGELTPVHTFFLLPITLVAGPTIAYNLAGWGSTVLSGWLAYRLARRWLADLASTPLMLHGAAFFAGTVFAFTPYRLTRLEAQLPLIGTGWLVLSLLAADRWVVARRWQDAGLLGLGVGLAALSSWYYAYILAMLLPVFILVRAENLRDSVTDRRTWLTAALATGIGAALVVPFLIPYLRLSAAGEAVVPLSDASFWSASPFDYFLPNVYHPLWGSTVLGLLWPDPGNWLYEFAMSPGWVTLLLGLWAWRQVRSGQWRALKWMIVGAFVLSLGPFLHLGRLPLPLPLPALLLRVVLPGADAIRSWDRFSILVILGLAVLGAAGLTLAVRAQPARRQALALGLALAGLLFELWPGPRHLTAIAPRPVDEWLAAQPDRDPIMQYPLSEALSGPAMFYTRYHQHPVTFGYGTYLPFVYRDRHPDLLTFPADPALDQLATWGVRYVLVDTEKLAGESYSLADIESQPHLRHLITLDGEAVFELEGP